MKINIDTTVDYLCICFTELEESKYSNVGEIMSFETYEEAVNHGRNWCRSIYGYPAEAHFHVWKFCGDNEN